MFSTRLAARAAHAAAGLHHRLRRLRQQPDHGGHAVEYAIGIAGSAVVILGVIAALKAGLADVIKNWVFQ